MFTIPKTEREREESVRELANQLQRAFSQGYVCGQGGGRTVWPRASSEARKLIPQVPVTTTVRTRVTPRLVRYVDDCGDTIVVWFTDGGYNRWDGSWPARFTQSAWDLKGLIGTIMDSTFTSALLLELLDIKETPTETTEYTVETVASDAPPVKECIGYQVWRPYNRTSTWTADSNMTLDECKVAAERNSSIPGGTLYALYAV